MMDVIDWWMDLILIVLICVTIVQNMRLRHTVQDLDARLQGREAMRHL